MYIKAQGVPINNYNWRIYSSPFLIITEAKEVPIKHGDLLLASY